MTPESLKQARAQIEVPGTTSFSFDIFDTFLLRRCTAPDGVYERAFDLAPIPVEYRRMADSFVQNRILAEQKARQIKWAAQRKTEATIDEIYEHFPVHSLGLPASARAALAAAEFAAELDLCFLNRDIFALFEAARARGVRVGFISDTYWSRDQLERLLRKAAPDLAFDFLYSSCDYGLAKHSGLMEHYLKSEALAPAQALHIGDNPIADVAVPARQGIRTIHYPQAPAALHALFQQEGPAVQVIKSQRTETSRRLDGGLAVMRRLAAARLPADAGVYQWTGAMVIGPVLTGFHRFIERRVAKLRAEGRRVQVLFLARDGFLPFRLAVQDGGANYVEINRRIALVGCSDGFGPLQQILKSTELIDDQFLRSFLKEDLPAVSEFIRGQPNQAVAGAVLADRLPELIGVDKMSELSRSMRERLLDYLRLTVVGFDDCTDLVLVDVGYFGTSQRALRGILDREGIEKNIHGIYLMTVDYQFADLDARDSVAGFLDDSVLTPQAKLMVQRNVALFEQFLSAPVGSVRNYDGSSVQREADRRPPAQLQLCGEVQDQCLQFFETYREYSASMACDPLSDEELARLWAAIILCRFLLMPSVAEQKAFGPIQHDVNAYTVASMVNVPEMEMLIKTMPLSNVYALREPPMWLAGSISAVSPMSAHLYALSGFGLAADGALADVDLGGLEANLIKGSDGFKIPVNVALTSFRDLRLRFPVLQKHTGSVIAVPLKGALKNGVIRTLTVQGGKDSQQAMKSRGITPLPIDGVQTLGAQIQAGHYRSNGTDAHILVTLPPSDHPLCIVTMTVSPILSAEG